MSSNPLLWKFILIAAVIGTAVFAGYPPADKINLGLDLQGGLHILYKVDTASAVKYEMDARVTSFGQTLGERNLAGTPVPDVAAGTIELRGADPAREDRRRDATRAR